MAIVLDRSLLIDRCRFRVNRSLSINYRTNEVQIGGDRPWQARVNLATPATEQPDVQLNFISGKQARHALRQGEQGFLTWVSAVEETKASFSDFREIIDSSSHSSHDERKELLRACSHCV